MNQDTKEPEGNLQHENNINTSEAEVPSLDESI